MEVHSDLSQEHLGFPRKRVKKHKKNKTKAAFKRDFLLSVYRAFITKNPKNSWTFSNFCAGILSPAVWNSRREVAAQ